MYQETLKDKFDALFHEIVQYQQIINSLRAEISEYKSKMGSILPEITRYHQTINSLKKEISEYKNKLDTMISERAQQENIDLLRAEIANYNNDPARVSSYGYIEDERILDLLGSDIARLKQNLDSIIVEV